MEKETTELDNRILLYEIEKPPLRMSVDLSKARSLQKRISKEIEASSESGNARWVSCVQ